MRIRTWLLAYTLSGSPLSYSQGLPEDNESISFEEKYRPLFHFTTPSGWLGEPTGIVFDGSLYHLFAKCSPDSLTQGASHWYHATSSNLVEWTHLGVVLSPRGKYDVNAFFNEWVGEATDGSAIMDVNGACGCGKQAILLYWTDREPANFTETGLIERQRFGCLFADDAYSGLVTMESVLMHVTKDLRDIELLRPYSIFLLENDAKNNPPYYAENEGTVTADFESDIRGPKIFNSGNTWHLALANCDRVVIYSSNSLAGPFSYKSSWGAKDGTSLDDPWRYHTPICDHTYEGTWGKMGASWELPDLIPLLSESNTIWWILFVSAASPENVTVAMDNGPNGGSGTQFFMGQFDGGRFLPIGDQGVGYAHWVDYGFDFYAARTIAHPNFGIEDVLENDAIMVAWMNNQLYSESLPTDPWRGAMTLPRRLTVKYVGNSPQLSQEFVGLDLLRNQIHSQERTPSNKIEARIVPEEGPFTTMEVNVTWRNIDLSADAVKLIGTFASENGDQTLRFGAHSSSNGTLYYFVERMPGGFDEKFDAMTTAVAPRKASQDADVAIQVVLDRSSIEMLADQGTVSITLLHFPQEPWKECYFSSDDVQWSWTLLSHHTSTQNQHSVDSSLNAVVPRSALLSVTLLYLPFC